jgi:hypothetical protein
MPWTLTPDIEAYASAVSELFGADPVRHTVLITVLASLIKHGPNVYGADPPVLAWWSPDGTQSASADAGPAEAAVLRTPPHPMHLTSLPEPAVASLVTALLDAGETEIGSIIGAEPDAAALAAAWSAATGEQFGVRMRQRLYRLDASMASPPRSLASPRRSAASPGSVRSTPRWIGAAEATAAPSP